MRLIFFSANSLRETFSHWLKGDEEKEIEKQNLCEKESLNEDAGLSSDFLYVNTFLIETCTSLLNEMKHDISYHFSFTMLYH